MRPAILFGAAACAALFIACRPTPCDCNFDNQLEAALAACPPDPSFPADLGTATVDLAPVVALDDGGSPIAPADLGPPDLSAAADLGPPSSCISVYRVVVGDAPLRQGRSPVSLVLDTLKLDETVTAIAEQSPFSNATVYRIVERGNALACGYVEGHHVVATEKSRTTKRAIDPNTDGARCIGGRK